MRAIDIHIITHAWVKPQGYQLTHFAPPPLMAESWRARDGIERTLTVSDIETLTKEYLVKGDYGRLFDLGRELDERTRTHPKKEREMLYGAFARGWIYEAFNLTQMRDGTSPPRGLEDTDLYQNGRVDRATFRQVIRIFKSMRDFKNGTNPHVAFWGVENNGIFGRHGLLRLRSEDVYKSRKKGGRKLVFGAERLEMMRQTPGLGVDNFDSRYQQARLVLLGMRGLSAEQLDRLFEFAAWERASRAKMGKLQAAMSKALARNRRMISEEEYTHLHRKSQRCWGMPGSPSLPSVDYSEHPPSDDAVNAARAWIMKAIADETPFPRAYLDLLPAQERARLTQATNHLFDKPVKQGWDSPLWRNPENGKLCDMTGKAVEVVYERQPVKTVEGQNAARRIEREWRQLVTRYALQIIGMFVG